VAWRYIVTFGNHDQLTPGSTDSLDEAVETAQLMSGNLGNLSPDLDGCEVRVWLCDIGPQRRPSLDGEPVARFRDGERLDQD
jgi:hypothetical protein